MTAEIGIAGEPVVGLPEVSKRFGVNVRTVQRWAAEGLPAPDGRVLRLPTVTFRRLRRTSWEAVTGWVRELQTPPAGPAPRVVAPPPPRDDVIGEIVTDDGE